MFTRPTARTSPSIPVVWSKWPWLQTMASISDGSGAPGLWSVHMGLAAYAASGGAAGAVSGAVAGGPAGSGGGAGRVVAAISRALSTYTR